MSTRSSPALSRWNSFNSAVSGHSGTLSVMDVLNLWKDDPEEVLLDLGFGCDEPDISGRIPARFINHQSQARGINIQVFLDAQKSRLDLENPDVSNRFRQLEVLHQVTTAFSSLVAPPNSGVAVPGRDQSAEARERRRRVGMLLRRASRKSLSQSPNVQEPPALTPESPQSPKSPPAGLPDRQGSPRRSRPGHPDPVSLTPLAEEQGPVSDLHVSEPQVGPTAREGARMGLVNEGQPLTANAALQRKKSPAPARESFEMEEIQSFDEGCVTGGFPGGAENTVWGIIRTNSVQSDSSGFLEEPCIPCSSQQASHGPELIKTLSGMSGSSTDSQITVREASSAPASPTSLPPGSHSVSRRPSCPKSPSVLPPSAEASLSLEMPPLSPHLLQPETVVSSNTSPSPSASLNSKSLPERCKDVTSPLEEALQKLNSGAVAQPESAPSSPPVIVPVSPPSFAECPFVTRASSPLQRPEESRTVKSPASAPSLPDFSHELEGDSPSLPQSAATPSPTSFTPLSSANHCPSACDPKTEIPPQMVFSMGNSIASQTEPPLASFVKREDTSLHSASSQHISTSPPPSDLLRGLEGGEEPSPLSPITELEGTAMSPIQTEESLMHFSALSGSEAQSQAHSQCSNLPSLAGLSPSSCASQCLTSPDSTPALLLGTDSFLGCPEEVLTEESAASSLPSLSPFCCRSEGDTKLPPPQPTSYQPPSNASIPVHPLQADSPLGVSEGRCTEEATGCPPLPSSPAVSQTPTDVAQAPLLTLPVSSHISSASSASKDDPREPPCLSLNSLTSGEDPDPPTVPSTSPMPAHGIDLMPSRARDLPECPTITDNITCRSYAGPCCGNSPAPAVDSPTQSTTKSETDCLTMVAGHSQMGEEKRGLRAEWEAESQAETVQSTWADVYVSGGSAAPSVQSRNASTREGNEAEMELLVHSPIQQDEVTVDPEQRWSRTTSGAVSDETGDEAQGGTELEPQLQFHDLIEIESLDAVFETSVDCSEGEGDYGDVDAICRELDSDGYVYWAEPIQLPSPPCSPDKSGSFEGQPALVSSPSRDRASYLSTSSPHPANVSWDNCASTAPSTTLAPSSPSRNRDGRRDSFRSSRSVSVQMPSSLSSHSVSHIVHRKDVPYSADPDSAPIPGRLPATPSSDTSDPLRVVQAWTGLRPQRNALTGNTTPGGLQALPTVREKRKPQPTISSAMSNDSLLGSAGRSISLDTGLWPDEEDEVEGGRGTAEGDDRRWEGAPMASNVCCCSCNGYCSCCMQDITTKQTDNFPYSLDELEGMMRSLRKFRSVLTDIEEQVSEDQASVYDVLSDQDREEVRDIGELRKAVNQEAGMLEFQLNELAHHYDDSFKMKMHRLLDEQSLLCSQLRLLPPDATPTSCSHAPTKSVATQCCLLPWLPLTDAPRAGLSSRGAWDLESSQHSLPDSEGKCEGLGCSPTKSDKLDFVGFLQRLKESLRHSVNTDSLE